MAQTGLSAAARPSPAEIEAARRPQPGPTWRIDFGSKPRVLTIAFARLWLSGHAYTRRCAVKFSELAPRSQLGLLDASSALAAIVAVW